LIAATWLNQNLARSMSPGLEPPCMQDANEHSTRENRHTSAHFSSQVFPSTRLAYQLKMQRRSNRLDHLSMTTRPPRWRTSFALRLHFSRDPSASWLTAVLYGDSRAKSSARYHRCGARVRGGVRGDVGQQFETLDFRRFATLKLRPAVLRSRLGISCHRKRRGQPSETTAAPVSVPVPTVRLDATASLPNDAAFQLMAGPIPASELRLGNAPPFS